IKVFDNSISKLRNLQTNLNRMVYTSTIQPKNLLKSLKRCDVAIGATRGRDRSPVVVSSSMVENMKPGAVIIDVSIDMGGCFETSEVTTHSKPTYEKFGVINDGVPDIPGPLRCPSATSSRPTCSRSGRMAVWNIPFALTRACAVGCICTMGS